MDLNATSPCLHISAPVRTFAHQIVDHFLYMYGKHTYVQRERSKPRLLRAFQPGVSNYALRLGELGP